MRAANARAARGIDPRIDDRADLQTSASKMADVQNESPLPLRILHLELALRAFENTRVADLAAGFAVKRCAIEDHHHGRLVRNLVEHIHQMVFGDDPDDFAVGLDRLVAQKLGSGMRFSQGVNGAGLHDRAREGLAAADAMVLVHQLAKTSAIDRKVVAGRNGFGQLDQEAVGLMQVEGVVSRDGPLPVFAQNLDGPFQLFEALFDCPQKILFFGFHDEPHRLTVWCQPDTAAA